MLPIQILNKPHDLNVKLNLNGQSTILEPVRLSKTGYVDGFVEK